MTIREVVLNISYDKDTDELICHDVAIPNELTDDDGMKLKAFGILLCVMGTDFTEGKTVRNLEI